MGASAQNDTQRDYISETLDWWRPLVAPPEPGKPSNRGELASLRRCKNLEEILFVPAYHRLYFRVSPLEWTDRVKVAAVAGLLAHVKGDLEATESPDKTAPAGGGEPIKDDRAQQAATVAALLASPTKLGLGPRVSELRFQRLVKITDLRELYPDLLRIIHLAGERVPVRDLIRSVRWWNEKQRRDWTYRYYDTLLDTSPKNQIEGA
jgi:CRISPR system Cascade subunit CasB